MAIAQREREVFGQPLETAERVIAGLAVLAGALGHAALLAAAGLLFYVLLFGL
ncbi:hypothetical protein SAMN05443574_11812 [Haloarcula vallismortis]|uniref:Uncharacterized protein n=2 Tax=Haloarcula vallismortis TaxID=28442 RepID=M0JJ06_HALVA|nr:hypothetical protein [Haloarcula vallismortis]EMA09102.1 hypothetical protein C437_07313 [Haloarcula vallismortis ATCC 29715]SDX19885.1 hypothetical protein SAMN05443574_11812 [Haloarcula vallismortis]